VVISSSPLIEGAIAAADYPRRRRRSDQPHRPRVMQLLASGITGGAQKHAADLILNLDRRAFEVSAVSLGPGAAVDRLRRMGMAVEVLSTDAFARRLRAAEIDLVHAHMFDAELAAASALAGLPDTVLVATIHSSRVRSAADRDVLAASNGRFARLIVPSRAIADKVVREGRGSVPRTLIPNGIGLGRHRSGPASGFRTTHGIPADAFLIGVVGRLEPEKGHAHLLAAMPRIRAAVPNAWLAIVGDGSLAGELRASSGKQVVFAGSRSDVAAVTAELDVSVLPSLREAQGLVLLEAMALGKPVVASRVGGIPEVVRHGRTGLLVPPADPAALAAAVIRIAGEPGFGARLGHAGRTRAERHFSLGAMVGAVERVYREELRRVGLAPTDQRIPPRPPGRASGEVPPT
jgi:glycosyltransferase involved in cell wall biosynthesis